MIREINMNMPVYNTKHRLLQIAAVNTNAIAVNVSNNLRVCILNTQVHRDVSYNCI